MPSNIEIMNKSLSRDRSPDGRLPDSEGGSKGRGGKGPYKQDETGLVPIPRVNHAPTYPIEIVERAYELMDEHRSVHQAQIALSAELGEKGLKGPTYSCLWHWAGEREEILKSLQADRKEQLIAVTGEVAMKSAERMLTALDGISDSQAGVYYGIAMDKRTNWENTGNKGNQFNVQFNYVRRSERE